MVKFLICKPRGGFIDMMSFVSMSLKYCEKYDRMLVIDTRKSLHFKDGFHKYFLATNSRVYMEDIDSLYSTFKKKTLFPGKSYIDYARFDPFIDKNATIKLNENYKEDIILFGNNNTTIKLDRDILHFFTHFSLKQIILNVLKQRFDLLPINYISVHIRNTDYKSDVDSFIQQNYNLLNDQHIFLATDDFNTIGKFQHKFKHIYTFSNIANSTNPYKKYYNRINGGIHFIIRDTKDHELFNIDTLSDFLLLSCSTTYLFSHKSSGFSVCANILFQEKNIITNIIKSLSLIL